jgi:hypothetical protein
MPVLVPRFLSFLIFGIEGSPDISQCWVSLGFARPLLVPALGLVAAQQLRNVWLRFIGKVLSTLSLVPAGLLALLFLISLTSETGREQHRNIYSPDGSHIAEVRVFGRGTPSADSAGVFVRSSWLAISTDVYRGPRMWAERISQARDGWTTSDYRFDMALTRQSARHTPAVGSTAVCALYACTKPSGPFMMRDSGSVKLY